MLDFKSAPLEKEPFDQDTRIRHGAGFGDLIKRASASLGIDRSQFMRNAAEHEARRILAARSVHVLTKDDVDAFEQALDKAPAPTPRALSAARQYRGRVVHAD